MKKSDKAKDDKEQVIGFSGQGKVVNFFDPYPDEKDENANNSDTVDPIHPNETLAKKRPMRIMGKYYG
ncbi:hypothetical protein [Rossellomorea vietnamensis]|uniref:hypothetical protein n=1 Tax=Rossellomorea vietnamensis TaxID=218284 RepID=UPI00077CD418|nr:hypothetical protein [Rossellomorea vietnamensis]